VAASAYRRDAFQQLRFAPHERAIADAVRSIAELGLHDERKAERTGRGAAAVDDHVRGYGDPQVGYDVFRERLVTRELHTGGSRSGIAHVHHLEDAGDRRVEPAVAAHPFGEIEHETGFERAQLVYRRVDLRVERNDMDVAVAQLQGAQHVFFHRAAVDDEPTGAVTLADFFVDQHGDLATRAPG
jgi:hypothetical protein